MPDEEEQAGASAQFKGEATASWFVPEDKPETTQEPGPEKKPEVTDQEA